ncbi:MAG: hypothetical protein PHS59_00170 [Paludibacter sp.]|nr:hypothetical protein [Paludibacter sp.]
MKQFKYILFVFSFPFVLFSQSNPNGSIKKIDLSGEWKFATEKNVEGLKDCWYSIHYNDSSWLKIQTGKGWNEQGISHAGFGWYRKKIFVPLENQNIPLVLYLGEIIYDDDVFFNGQKVGGLSGPYKYKNLINREYAVPTSLIKYGEENVIAIRTWGMLGNGTEGSKFGLAKGPFYASVNPMSIILQRTDKQSSVECDTRMFDISNGQQNLSFNIISKIQTPKYDKLLRNLKYSLFDYYDNELISGNVSNSKISNGITKATIHVDKSIAQKLYFTGRFKLILTGKDSTGATLFENTQEVDRLTYTSRDNLSLPDTFKNIIHNTPYGQLRLIDEIDCSLDVMRDEHPYMQSGFDSRQQFKTPGSPVKVNINEVLGKKVRESEHGWFAYRIGRGILQPHKMYLVRIEYPEDKPRYCPIEIQTGESYMDIGWKNGISPDNPYDNWPLSGKYQWFDAIVPLDNMTAGTSGSNGASSEHGFWIYFMNKANSPGYFSLYKGGPAISKIRLYEIDTEKNAPVIIKPQGLPERILTCDWERQALINPDDVTKYCKLMGYNAVSPVIMKWHFMNYADPLNGYNSFNVDKMGYWDQLNFDPKTGAKEAIPGKTSVHYNFLEATKKYGINYIPRVEFGGSLNLPVYARAISANGKPAKPNRFAEWCSDLLHPEVYDDFKVLLDFLINKNIKNYPQIKGVIWRIRCDRMPISYSAYDISLFSKETNTIVPDNLSDTELAIWASTGEVGNQYADWWHKKRADFHERLAKLVQSYRPDLKMYYYNWDNDKFSLGMTDFTGWDFLAPTVNIGKINPDSATNLYLKNIESRKRLTGNDYVHMIESGKFGVKEGTLPHHGLRPYLYDKIKGFEVFAPSNSLYMADNEQYLNYFKTKEGVAISNAAVYDESFARYINPKFEANEMVPGGPAFSMALELLGYFHTDANTLTYTSYNCARGFADAHRRFAQAFLALPAINGEVLPNADKDVRIRRYNSKNGIYVGVASKSYQGKIIKIKLKNVSGEKPTVIDLVRGKAIKATKSGKTLQFEINSGAMELNSFLVK